ncbi:hypothetical protein VNO77_05401 [Canavalia gladiata]|uniref:Secreted protein n=1 Tax=Canavalia gladiata TaxID=3824 RepID=A0AAN9MYA0_CANGL
MRNYKIVHLCILVAVLLRVLWTKSLNSLRSQNVARIAANAFDLPVFNLQTPLVNLKSSIFSFPNPNYPRPIRQD